MGIRESLTVNFEDKTLEYLDMMLYVTKQFEYKNKTYLYCVNKSTVDTDELEVYFLYRVRDDKFNHITDKKKQMELLEVVSGLYMDDLIKDSLKKIN
jgi:hypothetical protein